jgi:hypothetical protein
VTLLISAVKRQVLVNKEYGFGPGSLGGLSDFQAKLEEQTCGLLQEYKLPLFSTRRYTLDGRFITVLECNSRTASIKLKTTDISISHNGFNLLSQEKTAVGPEVMLTAIYRSRVVNS